MKKEPLIKVDKENSGQNSYESRFDYVDKRFQSLDTRMENLENKLDSIMKNQKMVKTTSKTSSEELKKEKIVSLFSPGDTLTIDQIISHPLFSSYEFKEIEKIILDLIDDEIFDGSGGRSKKKLRGNIGRLIKR